MAAQTPHLSPVASSGNQQPASAPGTPKSAGTASSSNSSSPATASAKGTAKSASDITHALSLARQESRRHQRRIRYPALILGAILMTASMFRVYTSWTSASSAALLVRDLLRSAGTIAWLCACLPSDHWAPKVGSALLFILGVKCAWWHTETMVTYGWQILEHYESGAPCKIENEVTDCLLGAFTIFSVSLMYIVMHLWQLPYLAFGLRLPPRATTHRMWVGLALLHLTKGATDFLVLLPAMAIKAERYGAIPYATIVFTFLHGVYGIYMGCLLRSPRFRQRVHFYLLSRSGALTAAASIAAFLGSRTSKKVMEVAQGACRHVSLDKVYQADMQRNTPDMSLQQYSTPCELQDVDAFLSHSWHDEPEAKWAALQAWRQSFKEQHQREPRVWIDKYCIDQTNIEASLMCLPVFLAGCHTLLIIAGPTYLTRLWCVEEVFVYLQMGRAQQSIEFYSLSDDMGQRVQDFDVQAAQTFLDVDREKLLATIEAGCDGFEEFNVQVRLALEAAMKSMKGTRSF